jgi:hypothetical protein
MTSIELDWVLSGQLLSILGYKVGFLELSFLIIGEFWISQKEGVVRL